MIFPEMCKYIGMAATRPCGEQVYFLSRYLVHPVGEGYEVLEVAPDPAGKGMMRRIVSSRVIAEPGEVYRYPEKVQIYDRAHLVQLALDSGYRCTIFSGLDEHMTFVLDPDLSGFLNVHVYDVTPPRPSLSSCIRDLEACGLFGELEVTFCHHIRDISQVQADVYPCRAAGFSRTLDADAMHGGERVVGCMTGSQLYTECYGKNFALENICPLEAIKEEPFIARCCRLERKGVGEFHGRFGAIVFWGATPAQIARAVHGIVSGWRVK